MKNRRVIPILINGYQWIGLVGKIWKPETMVFYPSRWCPPSYKWIYKPMNTIDISPINHSAIGLICTNWTLTNWGTTLWFCYPSINRFCRSSHPMNHELTGPRVDPFSAQLHFWGSWDGTEMTFQNWGWSWDDNKFPIKNYHIFTWRKNNPFPRNICDYICFSWDNSEMMRIELWWNRWIATGDMMTMTSRLERNGDDWGSPIGRNPHIYIQCGDQNL